MYIYILIYIYIYIYVCVCVSVYRKLFSVFDTQTFCAISQHFYIVKYK